MKLKKETRETIMIIGFSFLFMAFLTCLVTFCYKKEQEKARYESVGFITQNISQDEMFELLENRNGKLMIEIREGRVLDDNGNGEMMCGNEKYYIHYNPDEYKKGDEVLSIFVYNPSTNYVDDITHRVDIKK